MMCTHRAFVLSAIKYSINNSFAHISHSVLSSNNRCGPRAMLLAGIDRNLPLSPSPLLHHRVHKYLICSDWITPLHRLVRVHISVSVSACSVVRITTDALKSLANSQIKLNIKKSDTSSVKQLIKN